MRKKSLVPKNKYSSAFHFHGSRLSQLLTDLTRKAHLTKITFKDRHDRKVTTFPLLLAIVIFLIVPVLAAIALIVLLMTDYDIHVHQEEG